MDRQNRKRADNFFVGVTRNDADGGIVGDEYPDYNLENVTSMTSTILLAELVSVNYYRDSSPLLLPDREGNSEL